MPAPRERMLRLLSLLQSGRRWPALELAAAMDAMPRTVRRDIDHLRELGYPVESVRGPGGYYRLVAGSALPPLMLDDDEAIAIILGLKLATAGDAGVEFQADAGNHAMAKLRRILPEPLRRRAQVIDTAIELGQVRHSQPTTAEFTAFAAAISARRRVVFDYTGRSGSARRTVEPARLVRARQRWYVFAWDLDRDDWRSFRLDRIADPHTQDHVFEPRDLPADDLADHVTDRIGTRTERVVLILHADAREAASRLHRVDGSLIPIDEGSCRYIAQVDSFEWLATVLMLANLEFRVEEPAAFAEFLEQAGRRLLRGSAT